MTKAKLNLSNFQDARLDGADLREFEDVMPFGEERIGGMQK